jgi:hypothetical protein
MRQLADPPGPVSRLTADEEYELHPPPTPPETQGNA